MWNRSGFWPHKSSKILYRHHRKPYHNCLFFVASKKSFQIAIWNNLNFCGKVWKSHMASHDRHLIWKPPGSVWQCREHFAIAVYLFPRWNLIFRALWVMVSNMFVFTPRDMIQFDLYFNGWVQPKTMNRMCQVQQPGMNPRNFIVGLCFALRWIRDDWRIFPIDQWLQAKFQLTLGKWCRCGVWRHLCGSCDVITWQCGNQHPDAYFLGQAPCPWRIGSIDLVTYVAIGLLIDILLYIYIYISIGLASYRSS